MTQIVFAFLDDRTWSQAELARRIGIGVPQLRRHLEEMQRDFPLEREDDPPHVYWSLPKGWFPGGLVLRSEDAQALLRLLAHLPSTSMRNRVLERIVSAMPEAKQALATTSRVIAPALTAPEEHLAAVEDSATALAALRYNYFSASRGALAWRHGSVQRIFPGPPTRFVAFCHRDARLKWFRVDNIAGAHLDPSVAYHAVTESEVTRFVDQSIDGFAGDATTFCSFTVLEPDARWVAKNLPSGLREAPIPGGIRVEAHTSAVLPLARFIVGLGGVARVETPMLRAMVRALAEAALAAEPSSPSGTAVQSELLR